MRLGTLALGLLLLGVGTASCDAASNPLIGKWVGTHGDTSTLTNTNYCVIDWLQFTATAETVHDIAVGTNPASSDTVPVTYDFASAPNMAFIYVYGDRTRGTGYTLIDANTIRMEDSNRCIYKRAH